jgi:hypothetical protein
MNVQIRRSTLILPVNIPRFVEKAYLRGADAIMLDLEDAAPLQEKENARKQVKNALLLAGREGAEVRVRVNKDPASGETFPLPQVPIRLLQTPGEVRFPGLPMGSANEVVYQDILGYSSEEIGEMRAKGVI